MKKRFFNPITLLCCFLFVFTAIVADLSGKWTGVLSVPGGNDIDVNYDFKIDGSKLTGTASNPYGDSPIDNGKVDGDKFSFSVNVDGTNYPHSGKVYKDSCSLDIDFGGQKVHTILKHAK